VYSLEKEMSADAISAAVFVREYTRELHNKNAAVFAGAGLSMGSGYVDWATLLKEIVQDLGLDPRQELDLVTLAQYHCNQSAGNRSKLTQAIFSHFAPTKAPTANHKILARLPIHTYWTTNYDKLIERALEGEKKVPDVKYTLNQLPITRPNRDVVVYKMHGDIDHPADAVISKDDYESYPLKMRAFVAALRGDLVEKTFLFLGFSFTDPNIDYILSRVRAQYEQHQRHHYCVQRRVSKWDGETDTQLKYRSLKQDYFIKDLKRFGVQTVLVDEYAHITSLIQKVSDNYKRASIFISGAVEDYGTWRRHDAERFLHTISCEIASAKNRIITGFGLGVGGPIINGTLAFLNAAGKTMSDEDLMMRPFPQIATGSSSLAEQWTDYRKEMLKHAGIALFFFGNKRLSDRDIVLSNGMREEFDICVASGVQPLPIGATGFMATELWAHVRSKMSTFFPHASTAFKSDFDVLGDASRSPDELVAAILRAVSELQRP
jgi:hypothetical protein